MSNEKTVGTVYPRYGKMLATLSIVLGVISLFISVFFVSEYLSSRQLWILSGQPAPGWNFFQDLLGQWRVMGTGRIVPVGGLAYYATASCILGIVFGLVAAVCGTIAIAKFQRIAVTNAKNVRVRSIVGIASGVFGEILSGCFLLGLFSLRLLVLALF